LLRNFQQCQMFWCWLVLELFRWLLRELRSHQLLWWWLVYRLLCRLQWRMRRWQVWLRTV